MMARLLLRSVRCVHSSSTHVWQSAPISNTIHTMINIPYTNDLDGRVAIVTGGAQGIGRTIAHTLMKNGANVAIVDVDGAQAKQTAEQLTKSIRNTENNEANRKCCCIHIACDVTDEQAVEQAVRTTINQFGQADILVSNAGHQCIKAVTELEWKEWKNMISVHLDGAFLFSRAMLRHLYSRGKKTNGKIIFMGSVHSREASALKAPYVTAKHGMLGLARTIAKEAGPYGIAANIVCPGYVLTQLVQKQIPKQAEVRGISEQDVIDGMVGTTVDHQFTTAEDVANVVLFFARQPNNALTGQALNVSHGWCMS